MANVKTQRQSTCNACELKSGCGQHLISKIVGGQGVEFSLENSLSASQGDIVLLGVEESGVVKASVLMFLLPLMTMIIGVGIFSRLLDASSPLLALIALGTLLAGFFIARVISVRLSHDPSMHPQMTAMATQATNGEIALQDPVPVSNSVGQCKKDD